MNNDGNKTAPPIGPDVKVPKGCLVLDVRTPTEFSQGHFKGSMNIPVQELQQRVGELKPESKILVCCASGMRSGVATQWLKSQGFKAVENAGSWLQLKAE